MNKEEIENIVPRELWREPEFSYIERLEKDIDTLKEYQVKYPDAISALKEQIRISSKYRKALRKVASHGCCVMHNDRGCPGCTAYDALKV